jgi:hypothetical protein
MRGVTRAMTGRIGRFESNSQNSRPGPPTFRHCGGKTEGRPGAAQAFAPLESHPNNDFGTGDRLPQLQRVGILETPVLQAFRWRPPEIVAKIVDEVSSMFNKLQQPIFVNC